MKKLKKMIFLSIIIIIFVIYLIYNYFNKNEELIIEDEVYLEGVDNIEEVEKIYLHIIGEVKNPRSHTNRRRLKAARCNRGCRGTYRICGFK